MSDENNQQPMENNEQKEAENIKENAKTLSPLLKYSLIVITVFLGIFTATYIVVDMNMHRLGYMPFIVTMEQAQKMFDKEAGFIEKNSPAPVKIEQKENGVIVTVDLKHFDNDENNVNINIEDNGIKIEGKVKKENKGEYKESSFVQNVVFPNKFNKEKVTKTKKGNKLEIRKCVFFLKFVYNNRLYKFLNQKQPKIYQTTHTNTQEPGGQSFYD